MTQPEADLIAYAARQLGDAISVLQMLERGVGTASHQPQVKPQPAPPAPPAHAHPAPRRADVKPRLDELAETPVPACDIVRDYGNLDYWQIAARTTRAHYAAERTAPSWVDLGGEG